MTNAKNHPLVFGVLILLVSGSLATAERLRVTLWSLDFASNQALREPSSEMLQQGAATLRELNPDVILLRGVKDWQACNQLAQALKPAQYNVALCSSFTDRETGQRAARQLSILSKQKPYFFWSEAWRATKEAARTEGGFVFVAVQTPKQRLGFYCVDLTGGVAGADCIEQLLEHLNTVKRWEANSVQSAVVGGAFAFWERHGAAAVPEHVVPEAVTLLQDKGFADACFDLVPERRVSGRVSTNPSGNVAASTHMLAERNVFGVNPQETLAAGQLFVSCDLELDPVRVAAGWPARAQELERRSLSRLTEPQPLASAATRPEAVTGSVSIGDAVRALWWVAIPLLVIVVWLWARLRRMRRRLPLPPHAPPALLPGVEGGWSGVSSYTVVVTPQSVTGSAEKEAPVAGTTHPVLHLEPPSVQTHSAGAGWTPRSLVADNAARSRLLADLGRWLKQKLLRSLIMDRQRLLEAQHAAALKARAVDERLSKIEHQIQRQTRDYELRIDELTRELAAAKEENRELIRARIAQVKLEMETVRARILARAQADHSGPQL